MHVDPDPLLALAERRLDLLAEAVTTRTSATRPLRVLVDDECGDVAAASARRALEAAGQRFAWLVSPVVGGDDEWSLRGIELYAALRRWQRLGEVAADVAVRPELVAPGGAVGFARLLAEISRATRARIVLVFVPAASAPTAETWSVLATLAASSSASVIVFDPLDAALDVEVDELAVRFSEADVAGYIEGRLERDAREPSGPESAADAARRAVAAANLLAVRRDPRAVDALLDAAARVAGAGDIDSSLMLRIGAASQAVGDPVRAIALFSAVARDADVERRPTAAGLARQGLGELLAVHGRPTDAIRLYEEASALAIEAGDHAGSVGALTRAGALAIGAGDHASAARLWSSALHHAEAAPAGVRRVFAHVSAFDELASLAESASSERGAEIRARVEALAGDAGAPS